MTLAEKLSRVKVYKNVKKLKDYQIREFASMQKENSDRVTVISGYEGSGKSFLQMDLHENWVMNILKVKSVQKAFSTFCFKDVDWAKALVDNKDFKFMMITHDEAVNILYRKEGATKVNKEINKTFKKIRGKSWYHCMLIPQVHRLDKEMVEDRVRRLLFVVKHNGKRYVAVYTKQRLDSLISEINRMIDSTAKDVKSRPQVMNCATDPLFFCEIPEYKGRFLEFYADMKEDNMDESVDRIMDVIASKMEKEIKKVPKDLIKEKAMRLVTLGKNQAKVAHMFDVSLRTVQRWVQEDKVRNKA